MSFIRGFPHGSVVENSPAIQEIQEREVWSLGQEDALKKGMITHSSILACRIPWTEEPGRVESMGSLRVGRDWGDLAGMHTPAVPHGEVSPGASDLQMPHETGLPPAAPKPKPAPCSWGSVAPPPRILLGSTLSCSAHISLTNHRHVATWALVSYLVSRIYILKSEWWLGHQL